VTLGSEETIALSRSVPSTAMRFSTTDSAWMASVLVQAAGLEKPVRLHSAQTSAPPAEFATRPAEHAHVRLDTLDRTALPVHALLTAVNTASAQAALVSATLAILVPLVCPLACTIALALVCVRNWEQTTRAFATREELASFARQQRVHRTAAVVDHATAALTNVFATPDFMVWIVRLLFALGVCHQRVHAAATGIVRTAVFVNVKMVGRERSATFGLASTAARTMDTAIPMLHVSATLSGQELIVLRRNVHPTVLAMACV